MSPEDPTREALAFEFRQIDRELEILDRINQTATSDLDEIQLRAAASCLHSIYNGVERMLMVLLKARDVTIAEGPSRHSQILDHAATQRIIPKDVESELRDLMGFRHYYRHNYGFMLDGTLLKPVMENAAATVLKLKKRLVPGGR